MPDLNVVITIATPKISGVMSRDNTTLETKRIPVVAPKEAIVQIAPVIAFLCEIANWTRSLEKRLELPHIWNEMLRHIFPCIFQLTASSNSAFRFCDRIGEV